jgi:phage FluMu gp28-like protein
MKSLPVKRMCIDSTGMGAPIAEALSKKYRERVEGIDFSIATKEEMAMGIKIGLQQKRFILPNEKNLQNQIHSIKRKPSTGGHFRYDADRDENGHADSFWSFALANLAAGTEKKTGFYVQKAESNKMMNVREQEESVKPEEEKKIIRKGKGLNSLNRKMYEGW